MKMFPKETIALSKAIKEAALKEARNELGVGKHEITLCITIDGTITVGEDYKQDFWQIAKPEKTLLALACALNKTTADKITQEQYDRVLADVEGVAIKIGDKEAKRFKDDRAKALKKLRKPTKMKAKGKVTTDLTVTRVDKQSEHAKEDAA